jgi:hypothetical protein
MDSALQPPLRIQVTSTAHISIKKTHNRLVMFLADSQAHGTSKSATVQLEKLCAALQHERESTRTSTRCVFLVAHLYSAEVNLFMFR